MQEHVKIEHQHLRHVCHVCAKEYRTWPGLQSHLRSHSDKGPRIKCKMCGNLFINMYRLRLHKAKDHENATLLQCPHCPKMKTNLFQLKKHIAHSHNYKVHKCELCEREFRSPVEVSVGLILQSLAIGNKVMSNFDFFSQFPLAASHENTHKGGAVQVRLLSETVYATT